MKPNITHLAPYLPYGLKWKFDGEDFTHDIVGLDITNRGVKLVSPYNDYGDCEISSGKPLLLPMSSLYTEMEDGTVPIVELAKIAFPKNKFELNRSGCWFGAEKFIYSEATNSFRTLHEDGGCFSQGSEVINQLTLFTYLFPHHFDVYNLIPQNLAIDKTKYK